MNSNAVILNDNHETLIAPLRRRAAMLNAIDTPSADAVPAYEEYKGIVWADERLDGVSAEILWGLQPVWSFRTSLIVGRPEEFWQPYWEVCRTLFPNWIGFRSERRRTSPELIRLVDEAMR